MNSCRASVPGVCSFTHTHTYYRVCVCAYCVPHCALLRSLSLSFLLCSLLWHFAALLTAGSLLPRCVSFINRERVRYRPGQRTKGRARLTCALTDPIFDTLSLPTDALNHLWSCLRLNGHCIYQTFLLTSTVDVLAAAAFL